MPALEEWIRTSKTWPVLDHGFVRVVDYMGDDQSIDDAARISYGVGTRRLRQRRGLLRYLMRHRHTSPFEMCELVLHLRMPLFVARQVLRHRTASVNEYSARYSVMPDAAYVPPASATHAQSASNRQGRGVALDARQAGAAQTVIREGNRAAFNRYTMLLNGEYTQYTMGSRGDDPGIARELARTVLPVGAYTELVWKMDLHNLLHFLSLRTDAHAQWEIREYANVIAEIVAAWVPLTHEAWVDYRKRAVTVSADGWEVIRGLLAPAAVARVCAATAPERAARGGALSNLSAREWEELRDLLQPPSEEEGDPGHVSESP